MSREFRMTGPCVCALLAFTGTSLHARDGSSATSPIIVTEANAADYLAASQYRLDGGKYFEVSSAVTLAGDLALGHAASGNHLTVTGQAAALTAGDFRMSSVKGGNDWFVASGGAAVSFAGAHLACADAISMVTLDGDSTLTVTGDLVVGEKGRAFLNIAGGSVLTARGDSIIIGKFGSAGGCSVTVSGGAMLKTTAGDSPVALGQGSINPNAVIVSDEGSVWYSQRPVEIGGADSSILTITGGALAVFDNGVMVGTNSAIVLDFGTLALRSAAPLGNTAIDSLHLYVMGNSGPTRITSANIDSLVSTLVLDIEYYDGTNTLFADSPLYASCTARGIDLNGCTVIKAGIFNLTGNPPENDENTLTINGGTAGTPDIHRAGADETWDDVHVGYSTLNNQLIVSGGTFTNGATTVAEESGSSGSVTVTGSGTKWVTSGTLCDGDYGTARFCVQNGAHATANTLEIGKNGDGTCLVTGLGSILYAETMNVGVSGRGLLRILDNAFVLAESMTCEKGAVQLDGGVLAVRSGESALGAEAIAALHISFYDGISRTGITAENLTALEASGQVDVQHFGQINYLLGFPSFLPMPFIADASLCTVIRAGVADMSWTGATECEGGWYHSSWGGWFYRGLDYGSWVWSTVNGWQYVADLGDRRVAVWDDASQSWCYTGEGVWPYVYLYGTGSWLYYNGGTAPERTFWSWANDAYVTR
jgi:T5SS/PEP-CTERM-associated repeat protein